MWDADHLFRSEALCWPDEVLRWVRYAGLALIALGGAQGCTFGPTPAEFAATLVHLPQSPVCWYVARDIKSGEKSGVVMCNGSAVVDPAELTRAAFAKATYLASGAEFVVVSERIDPVAEVGVLCDAVPLIPWSRRTLLRRTVCWAVPEVGPPGHFLQLDVHFPAGRLSDPTPDPHRAAEQSPDDSRS